MSTAPAWFDKALATRPDAGAVTVDGCDLHTLRWGERGKPGLVLVHGGAAHARWWSFLAPFFTPHYDVLALDLSGHGDSGRRESYPRDVWAREVVAVAQAAGFPGPPVVVGHSMGGLVAIVAASLFGERLAGAIVVDSPVYERPPETQAAQQGRTFGPLKVYPDLATAVGRFRLIPDQPCDNRFILDYIARESVKELPPERGGGFTWKFDPRIFSVDSAGRMSDYLATVKCRVALLRGELSHVVPRETGEYMYRLLDRTSPLVEIPEAHHHLILDQPLAFVAATRALLADWDHSVPRRHA